jgi:hypothetical protein
MQHRKKPEATMVFCVFLFVSALLDLLKATRAADLMRYDVCCDSLHTWFSADYKQSTPFRRRNVRPPEAESVFPLKLLPEVTIPDRIDDHGGLLLWHVLEGIATWKEYLAISQLAWFTQRTHFKEITTNWLAQTRDKSLYRFASDLILASTGANMSMALPGILLDIALNPDLSSPLIWSDFHPVSRLRQLLAHAGELPLKYKRFDNCELVDDGFYREVESFFSSRLGWQTVSTSALNMARTIRNNAEELIKLEHDNPAGKGVALAKFVRALEIRAAVPSAFLFSWNSPDPTSLDRTIRPLVIEWMDEVQLSHTNPEERYALTLEAYTSVRRLVLELMIRTHSGHGRDLGHIERLYHKVKSQYPSIDAPNHIYSYVAKEMKITETTLKSAVIRRFI